MSITIYYLHLLPALRDEAKQHGYALAIHGSMTRDFDVVADPWTAEASEPFTLADALRDAVDGYWHDQKKEPYHLAGQPGLKPHGRLCWTIHLGGGAYIDLSVFPRRLEA